jgi:Flp pilus assembly protein TadG
MRRLRTQVRRFLDCARGNYAVMGAITLPLIAGIAGGAVDFYVYNDQQKTLQNVADSATLAAAREASLGGWSQATAEAVVDSYIAANLKTVGAGSAIYTRTVAVDRHNRRVTVTIDQDHYGYFVAGYFRHSPQIRVTSVAQASGNVNICVIGLHTADAATLSLNSDAELSAPNCAVYSNSSDAKGMRSLSNARLTAGLACSAGGYEGAAKNYNRPPLTDCPVVADPLASRPARRFLQRATSATKSSTTEP